MSKLRSTLTHRPSPWRRLVDRVYSGGGVLLTDQYQSVLQYQSVSNSARYTNPSRPTFAGMGERLGNCIPILP